MANRSKKSIGSSNFKCQSMNLLLFCLALLGATLSGNVVHFADCLRISSIGIPAAVSNGSQVTLTCNYKLANDEQLYSVKWYKNYIEFYRYEAEYDQSRTKTPKTTTTATSMTTTGSPWAEALPRPVEANDASGQFRASTSREPDQASPNTEFGLDGINVDLYKSNDTHVYLKQVNTASDGTYRCEISADSPTFATVSAERQLKIYVLPKQKLAILDNSPPSAAAATPSAASTPPGGVHQNQGSGASVSMASPEPAIHHQSTNSLVYTLNDQINLTCLAAPSRPAAQLEWFINELPVSSSSKWLTSQSIQHHQNQLTETRLTLAFKLQPSYSFKNGSTASLFHDQTTSFRPTSGNSIYPVRLRCIAKLSVEYASETSIQVSGGKTTIKRRQQHQQHQQQPSALPIPSSLIESLDGSHDATTAVPSSLNKLTGQQQKDNIHDYYPIYRWPRPSPLRVSPLQSNSGRYAPSTQGDSSAADYYEREQKHNFASSNRQPNGRQRSSSLQRQNVFVVWSSSQLKAQSEHIEQMLRKSHPNELDQPIVEAKTNLDNGADDSFDSESVEGDDMSLVMDESVPGTSVDDRESYQGETKTTMTTTTTPFRITTPQGQYQASSDSLVKDYELNDSVQFKCRAQVALPEMRSLRSVRLNWYINDKEIDTGKVNSFDGSRFLYDPQSQSNTQPISDNDGRDQGYQSPTTTTFVPTTNYPIDATKNLPTKESNDHLFEHPYSTHLGNLESRDKTLTIELTPKLYQLKELNLKCRTIVEQPLIEYENQLIASVAINPFIEVDNSNDNQANNQFYLRPYHAPGRNGSGFNKHRPNVNTNNGGAASQRSKQNDNNNRRNSVYKLRQQHSSSSSPLSSYPNISVRWELWSITQWVCSSVVMPLMIAMVLGIVNMM